MPSRKLLATAVAVALIGYLALPIPSFAEVASALIREGDTIPGQGDVSALVHPAANHVGGYSTTLNTTTGVSLVWGNGAGGPGGVILTEGTYAGYQQNSFEAFHGLSDAGDPAYSAICDEVPPGATGLDTVWVDIAPVLVEERPVPSLPGQFSSFSSRPAITADGHPYWVGGITAIQGGATQNRVLFFGFGLSPLFKGGDPVGGVLEPAQINTGAVDFNVRLSEFGTNWLMEVLVQSGSSLNDGVVVANGTAVTAGGSVMRESFSVPPAAGGLPLENWDNFDYFGINETGLMLVTGDTDAGVTEDEFVLLGGQIVLREGAVVNSPVGPLTVSGAIESASMNEQGDWAVTWDVNRTTNVEALIMNGEVLLMEGDSVDLDGDGTPENDSILVDFTGIAALVVADRNDGAVSIYFTADVDTQGTPSTSDDIEGLFRLVVGNQSPVALCQDVTVAAGSSCEAEASVDRGSFDPDGDPITLEQAPPGPYPLGTTEVTLTVTDDQDASDSCTATVTIVPAPLELQVDPDELSWAPPVCDVGYDVVRGDLQTLLAGNGDFSAATQECLADNHTATSLSYSGSPTTAGSGYWFLARRIGASGNGSYDSEGPAQQGSRDAGIAASGVDCP